MRNETMTTHNPYLIAGEYQILLNIYQAKINKLQRYFLKCINLRFQQIEKNLEMLSRIWYNLS
jgi:hypothetical protein